MKKQLILFFFLTYIAHAYSQDDNLDSLADYQLKEFVKSGYIDDEKQNETTLVVKTKLLNQSANSSFSLSSKLAEVPGVDNLSTGLAIDKPVIRGMYGNRVLILVSGLKFDNMQWQEEHGLGLTSMGLSKAEIIKGPIGVLYGSEAVGGAINMIEELPPIDQKHHADANLSVNSNTLGGRLDVGYKKRTGNKWYRIRLGIENNADYIDGNQNRVLNSRFKGYALKASFGFEKKHWESKIHLMSSYNRYGFIFNDIYDFVVADDRNSRQLTENPAHIVLLNVLSTENKIKLNDKAKLFVNLGLQSNNRMENEGGGAISLNMLLMSVQSLVKLQYDWSPTHKITVSTLNSLENNQNFGARKIVPDAIMEESNLSIHSSKKIGEKLVLANGFGIGEKYIKTGLTRFINDDEEISPFAKKSFYYNALSGVSYHFAKHLYYKLNFSTGIRVPNLAELSSNGLHEGVFTYEIGDPSLANERIFAVNTSLSYVGQNLKFSVSPFYNRFNGYVYLSPTNEQKFGFPVYRFKQQHATQYGGEVELLVKFTSHFSFEGGFSAMESITDACEYLPFIPATQYKSKLQYETKITPHWQMNTFVEGAYKTAQNRLATNELGTPNYELLNSGVSFSIKKKAVRYHVGVEVNNLLDKAYYDHLSRFKYFGLLNMGRNVNISASMSF